MMYIVPILNDYLFIIIVILTSLFAALILIVIIIFNAQKLDYQRAINQRIHHYLIYRIHLETGRVEIFNLQKPKLKQSLSMETFLKTLTVESKEKFETWLLQLIKARNETTWTFKVSLSKSDRVGKQVIFDVEHVHYDDKIIHLRRYGLRYMQPGQRGSQLSTPQSISIQKAIKLFAKLSEKDGSLIYFQFNFGQSELDDQFKLFYLTQIKERLIPFIFNQFMIMDTTNDLYMVTTRKHDRQQLVAIAQTFIRVIARYLEVNALNQFIQFTIAIVEHKYFAHDLKAMIRQAKNMTSRMVTRQMMFDIYDPNQPFTLASQVESEKIATEIYGKHQFNVLYRPAVTLDDAEHYAYQVDIATEHKLTTSSTIIDLLQEAATTRYGRDFYVRYFAKLEQELQQNFTPLCIPLSIQMPLKSFLKDLDIFNAYKGHTFLFDEQELLDYDLDESSIIAYLDQLHQKSHFSGLMLTDAVMDLSDEVYKRFHYFILDARHVSLLGVNEKASFLFKLIISQFSRFHIPFIIFDLPEASTLELIPLNHVKIIGADFLQPWQVTPTMVNKKAVSRLKQYVFKQEKIYGKTR